MASPTARFVLDDSERGEEPLLLVMVVVMVVEVVVSYSAAGQQRSVVFCSCHEMGREQGLARR